MIIIALLILCSLCLSKEFDLVKEPAKMLNMINNERQKLKLAPVTFNWDLKHELDSFNWVLKETNNTRWFYESTLNKSMNVIIRNRDGSLARNMTNRLNGAFLMEEPKFKKWEAKGWKYIARDTMVVDFANIIKMRLDQRNCIDINLCNGTVFNYFTTCAKEQVLTDRKKCAYSSWYYPFLMNRNLKEISYVRLDVRGRYAPVSLPQQLKSAWLYGNYEFPQNDKFL